MNFERVALESNPQKVTFQIRNQLKMLLKINE